jgi:exonuclease SbcC
MKIDYLKVKNWQGHVERELRFEGPIVGLSGENGSGKTTLMNAIVYAIFGKLPPKKKATTMIRDYGLENGANSALVEAEFNRMGYRFNVTRTLNAKGSERKLTLPDGSEFTYADQVDEQMSNILGADLESIMNVVFIPQGDLKNILFGTEAEQERLLIKILDVGHLADSYKVISSKINFLQAKVDSTINARLEQVELRILQSEKDIASMKEEISHLPELEADEVWTLKSKVQDIANKDLYYRNKNKDLIDQQEEYTKLNAGNRIETIKNKLLLEQGSTDQNGIIHGLKLEVKTLEGINPLVPQIIAKCDNISRHYKSIPSLDLIKKSEEFWATGISGNSQTLQILLEMQQYPDTSSLDPTIATLETSLEVEREKIRNIEKECTVITTKISNLAYYKNVSCDHDANCSQCGSVLTEETINKNKQELANLEAQLNSLKPLIPTATLQIRSIETELANQKNQKTKLENICTKIPKRAFEIYQETKNPDILRNLKGEFENILTTIKNEETIIYNSILNVNSICERFHIPGIQVERSLQTIGEGNLQSIEAYCKGVLEALSTCHLEVANQISGKDSQIRELQLASQSSVTAEEREVLKSAQAIETKITQLKTIIESMVEVLQTEEEDIDKRFKSFNLNLDGVSQFADKMDAVVAVLTTNTKKREDLSVLESVYNNYQKDRNTILAEREKAKPLLELITDLERLKAAFSREGIANRFIKAKFSQLINATKENLRKLAAPFDIEQDEDKPLCFVFRRYDKGPSNWLPQDMMSGGQRVRLCLAFIMAVQQILVPNLGFLMLDEPSNHIDERGADDLRDFLIRLKPELEASNMQLIVCDHKESISSAYSTKISL